MLEHAVLALTLAGLGPELPPVQRPAGAQPGAPTPDEGTDPPAPVEAPVPQAAPPPGQAPREPPAPEPPGPAPAEPAAAPATRDARDRARRQRGLRQPLEVREGGKKWREGEFDRRGFMFGVSVALTNCPQNDQSSNTRATTNCDENLPGPLGRVELGYRAPSWLAVFASVSYSFNGKDVEDRGIARDIKGTYRVLDVGAGLMLFPVLKERIDPFVAAMVGYTRQLEVEEIGDDEIRGVLNRGLVRLTVGWNIYFRHRFSVGPRFDIDLPFLGQACVEATLDLSDEGVPADCEKIADIPDRAGLDSKGQQRAFRRSFPTPWSLGIGVMGVF